MRIIRAAQDLSRQGETYAQIRRCLSALGYRGHPITKSRAYSVTFGQLRRVRRTFKRHGASLPPNADVRQVLDVDEDDLPNGFAVISDFHFVGCGYLSLDAPADAVRSAALARIP